MLLDPAISLPGIYSIDLQVCKDLWTFASFTEANNENKCPATVNQLSKMNTLPLSKRMK